MTRLPNAVLPLVPADAIIIGPHETPATKPVAGAEVVLHDNRPGARRRLRRRARLLQLDLRSEYLVLPTWRSAAFVIEDDPDILQWFWRSVATIPPGFQAAAPFVEGLVRVGGTRWAQRMAGGVAPGRVAVGVSRR